MHLPRYYITQSHICTCIYSLKAIFCKSKKYEFRTLSQWKEREGEREGERGDGERGEGERGEGERGDNDGYTGVISPWSSLEDSEVKK